MSSGNKKLDALLAVLHSPPADRTDADIDLCHAFFQKQKFLRAVGAESEKARDCCRYMVWESFEENAPVYVQGDDGDRFFFVLTGSVRLVVEGVVASEMGPWDSFGELEVLGHTEEERKRLATIIAEERTQLVSLHRAPYLQAAGGFEEVVEKVLQIPSKERTPLDLDILLVRFDRTEFFQQLYFTALERKCCEYVRPKAFERGETLVLEGGKKGKHHLCVVVSGSLSLTQRDETHTFGVDDSFMGDAVSADGGILTATEDGVLAVLKQRDHDEVTASSFKRIKQILETPPHKRGREDLELLHEMFCHGYKTTPFLRALPSAVLRKNSCKMLGCRELSRGTTVFSQGEDASCFFIVIYGSVELTDDSDDQFVEELTSGSEFGHFKHDADDEMAGDHRTTTATVTSDTCLVASLEKSDFLRLCQLDEIQIWVQRFWKLMTMKEPANDDELRIGVFDVIDEDHSGKVDRLELFHMLDSLGQRPSEEQLNKLMAALDLDNTGLVDFEEFSTWWWGENAEERRRAEAAPPPEDLRATFERVDTDATGVIDYEELFIGLKELGVVQNDEDEAVVHALLSEFDTDSSGALDLEEFSGLCEKLHLGQSTLAMLDSKKAPSTVTHIQLKHYQQLHTRIAKSIAPDFSEDEMVESAKADWAEDLVRFASHDQVDQLDLHQFGHAMFQLVDEWCGGASSTQMIVVWLRTLFGNIVHKLGYFRKVKDIVCVDDELTNLCEAQRERDKELQRANEEAFRARTAAVKKRDRAQTVALNAAQQEAERIAEAERAKAAKAAAKREKAKAKLEQKMKNEEARRLKAEEARQREIEKEKAKAEKKLAKKLKEEEASRLKAEQAQQRDAAIATQADAIAAERLKRLQHLESLSMSSLDDEEAELLRRLESGELTAEEEAEVRAQLKAIGEARTRLQEQEAQHESEKTLAALDEEEAELRRRLESGELTAEEEAQVRARLVAIADEREAVYAADRARLESHLKGLDAKLSALDDEEAELRRRLEAGGLTVEEEAELKARLKTIEVTRQQLKEQRDSAAALAGQRQKEQEHAQAKQDAVRAEAAQAAAAAKARELAAQQAEAARLAAIEEAERLEAERLKAERLAAVRFSHAHPEVQLQPSESEAESGAGGASSVTRLGNASSDGIWRAVSCSEMAPMTEGEHFAEFTIEQQTFGIFLGAIRPNWDVQRHDGGAIASAAGMLCGHCLYHSGSGRRWPDNKGWAGMEKARPGDRIGLLLDLDQGSMTAYKNGKWLGVMAAAGLCGDYCWAVSLGADADSVSIRYAPVPERTAAQLAAAKAVAGDHIKEMTIARQEAMGTVANLTMRKQAAERKQVAEQKQTAATMGGTASARSTAPLRPLRSPWAPPAGQERRIWLSAEASRELQHSLTAGGVVASARREIDANQRNEGVFCSRSTELLMLETEERERQREQRRAKSAKMQHLQMSPRAPVRAPQSPRRSARSGQQLPTLGSARAAASAQGDCWPVIDGPGSPHYSYSPRSARELLPVAVAYADPWSR
jgi:Ca2+-binding EF-hand superfamily protein